MSSARPALLLALLCCGSLFGWPGLRDAEQGAALFLLPADPLVKACLPAPMPAQGAARERDLTRATEAWDVWCRALMAQARPVDARYEARVVPVLAARPEQQELLVRVPVGGVRAGSPVTSQGVLLGFLRPWGSHAEVVESGGRARVALLGHPLARPVAASWQLAERAVGEPVHFLITSGPAGPRVAHSSSDSLPPAGQLAWTRDVSRLGDALPAGFLVGRLEVEAAADLPGGGLPGAGAGGLALRLQPVLDAYALSHVVIESAVGQEFALQGCLGHVLASGTSAQRVRLDVGRIDGVQGGDLVVQDGQWLGTIESAGPLTSVVRLGLPDGQLLVVSPDDEIVATTAEPARWPADWTPSPGALVLAGHVDLGGLLVGTVVSADAGGLSVLADPPDPARPVRVVPP